MFRLRFVPARFPNPNISFVIRGTFRLSDRREFAVDNDRCRERQRIGIAGRFVIDRSTG